MCLVLESGNKKVAYQKPFAGKLNMVKNNSEVRFKAFRDQEGNLNFIKDASQINAETMGYSYKYEIKFLPTRTDVKVKLNGWRCILNYEEVEREEIINTTDFNYYIKALNELKGRNTLDPKSKSCELINEALKSIFGITAMEFD